MVVTRILVGMLLLLMAGQAGAEDCVFPEHDLTALPDTGGTPLEVNIHLYLNDINEIHDSKQSFVSDVFIRAQWQDSRLLHSGTEPCYVDQTDIWTPQLQLLNRRSLEQMRPARFTVTPEGGVMHAERVYGDFSFREDLSDFPFDQQELRFIIVSGYESKDVIIVADKTNLAMADELSVSNWKVQLRGGVSGDHYVAPLDRDLSRFDIVFDARRLTGFYTWQLLVPLVLVVMMTWTVFWLPIEIVPPRVGLVATSMLTLIAYRFAMASILPPIAYLTRLDQFMVASSVLVFGALAATVAVTWLDARGNSSQAVALNTASRALAPGLFLVVFLKVFVF